MTTTVPSSKRFGPPGSDGDGDGDGDGGGGGGGSGRVGAGNTTTTTNTNGGLLDAASVKEDDNTSDVDGTLLAVLLLLLLLACAFPFVYSQSHIKASTTRTQNTM